MWVQPIVLHSAQGFYCTTAIKWVNLALLVEYTLYNESAPLTILWALTLATIPNCDSTVLVGLKPRIWWF